MNTLLFTYAVEIEKVGSITQAAQNLYMAQPNQTGRASRRERVCQNV